MNNTIENGNENFIENNYASSLQLTFINNLNKFNANELRQASDREIFPSEDCEDAISPKQGRFVLRKGKKRIWETLNEAGTELPENFVYHRDVGPIAEWESIMGDQLKLVSKIL